MYEHKKISRRKALSTIGKIAITAVVAGAVAGVGGYYVGSAIAPAKTVTKKITITTKVGTPTTVTKTVAGTPTTITKTVTKTVTKTITQTPTYVFKPKKRYKWGLAPYYIDDDWYRTDVMGAKYYADMRGYELVVQNPHGKIEEQIKQIRYMVTGMGIEGLIVTPCDLVVIVDTLEWVKDQGVPIIATFYDVDTDAVDLSIIPDFHFIGKRMAEELIKRAKKDGVGISGPVFIVTGPSVDYQSKTLTEGEMEYLKNYPDLEVIRLECPNWGTDEAISRVVEGYHGYGRPFAILANNMTTGVGIVEGVKTAGIAVPRGKEGHVYLASFDGCKSIQDAMEEGLLDCFADIANPHIDCIAQDLLCIIKEQGVDALPDVGTTIISDPSKPFGPQPDGTWNLPQAQKTIKGVNPWALAPWAPAKVTMYKNYHRRLNTGASIVIPETLPEFKKYSWVKLVEAWLG